MRRISNPKFQFDGVAIASTYPTAKVSRGYYIGARTYDPVEDREAGSITLTTVTLYSSPLTLFILGNTTEADGLQRIVFTLSRCIADGNPRGFCDRLSSRTIPLFIACVHARRCAQQAAVARSRPPPATRDRCAAADAPPKHCDLTHEISTPPPPLPAGSSSASASAPC